MRRTIVIALVAAVALTTAGIAVATLGPSGVSATTATFSAARSHGETRTCTGNGSTYEITRGRYVGTIDFAEPNNELDGPLTIDARSVLNTTTGIGYVDAWVRGRDGDRTVRGRLVGTLDGSGKVDGFFQGRASHRSGVLLGAVSATFTAAGGFADGRLGNGTTSLPAVLVGKPCTSTKPAGIAVRLLVRGDVAAIAPDAITVNPRDGSPAQSCKLKAGVSPSTAGIAVGSKVEIRCGLVQGEMTLLKLKSRR